MRTKEVKGWGQLPRDLAKALARTDLSKNEGKLLWAIVYKTIAFNKSEDKIPQSQLVDLTGIDQRHMTRTINSLLKKGVILRKGNKYGFLLDFTKGKNTPVAVYNKKYTSSGGKYTSSGVKNTPVAVPSRELFKRAFQEKGVSPFYRKKKLEEFKKGMEMMKEAIGKIPGKKK